MSQSPFRVLIVDGNADFADSVTLLLREAGYQCETAVDVVSGVAKAEGFQPHIVFFDLDIPGDGYHLPPLIRGACKPAPKLIAVVGRADKQTKLRLAGLGVLLHVVKPVEPSALRKLLARLPGPLDAADEKSAARAGATKHGWHRLTERGTDPVKGRPDQP